MLVLTYVLIEYRDITNRDEYLFANSEAMKMQVQSFFEETEENWPHILRKYAVEANMVLKGGIKTTLPPETPNFVK